MIALQLTRSGRRGIMHTFEFVLGVACLLARHVCGLIVLVPVTLLVTLTVDLLVTCKVVEVESWLLYWRFLVNEVVGL